jgi:hypothetical protein
MASKISESELREIVDAILHDRASSLGKPHELMDSLTRRRLQGEYFSIIEPLLGSKHRIVRKQAIDIVGKMKNAPDCAAAAVEEAWNESWEHDVPQACDEAFRALLRLGGNDARLLTMIDRAMKVDNYGIHKVCAETLMKIEGGDSVLANWSDTIGGKCECHLHRKLSEKIAKHLAST